MLDAPSFQAPPSAVDARTRRAGPATKPGQHRHRYRSAWISDTHLGTRGCQADQLLHFLRHTQLDTLYLVGDIIDGWSLKRSWYWPPSHGAVVRAVCELARAGTRVIYVPGNHDEMLRDFDATRIAGVRVQREAVHETADGRRLLVIHGDDFDAVCTQARWLAVAGDYAYRAAVLCNHWFNRLRRRLGYPYWSLANFLKHQVKNAVSFISDFEHALAREARRRGLDGVICGHIHCARHRWIEGVEYCNDGDWVESCTALVEHACGRLEILHWGSEARPRGEAALADTRADA